MDLPGITRIPIQSCTQIAKLIKPSLLLFIHVYIFRYRLCLIIDYLKSASSFTRILAPVTYDRHGWRKCRFRLIGGLGENNI